MLSKWVSNPYYNASYTVSDSISLLCLPTFYNDPTKWLNMYIEGFVYCWLSRSFVFLELFTLFAHGCVCAWMYSCVCRYMERFSINVSERVRKSLQNICINCNYGNMFLPQNVLYTFIYITHSSSFCYDEFQDMRIRCFAMRCRNRANFYELSVTHD